MTIRRLRRLLFLNSSEALSALNPLALKNNLHNLWIGFIEHRPLQNRRYRARFRKLSGTGAFGLRLNLRVQVGLVVAGDVITLIIIVVMRLNTQVVKHHTQYFRAHVL
jgi:hypothetical protein